MKTFKIVIGLLILYSLGKEYINASKQLFTFLDPAIIIINLILLILCAWLIGSGISKEKLKIKSWQFAKYYFVSLILFLLFAFVSLTTFKFDPEIVKINSIDVDIAEFMNGTKNIIPDENQRREYCICVVTKLTADKDLVEKHKDEFQRGKFSKLIISIESGANAFEYNLHECFGLVADVQWTPEVEKGMRASITKKLNESQVSATNDVNKYCDCLIEEYKTVSFKELSGSDFPASQKGRTIDSICDLKSKLK